MPVPFRNTKSAYGVISQTFHWLIVALLIVQYAWAWRIDGVDGIRARLELVTQHKTIGMSVLILAVLRLLWRMFNRPPPLPAGMPRWESLAARAGHWMLYGLIIAVPLSGWAYSSAAGYGDYWWGPVDFPGIAPTSEALEDLFHEIHEWLTTTLAVVAIGHTLAALRHHFWLKDDVMTRMLPTWRRN
ncbi:MAG: cytochrome b [Pseudomonadota bacterium]|nr:MAG: cytochrome b [Pseudomonadota bacterium]